MDNSGDTEEDLLREERALPTLSRCRSLADAGGGTTAGSSSSPQFVAAAGESSRRTCAFISGSEIKEGGER